MRRSRQNMQVDIVRKGISISKYDLQDFSDTDSQPQFEGIATALRAYNAIRNISDTKVVCAECRDRIWLRRLPSSEGTRTKPAGYTFVHGNENAASEQCPFNTQGSFSKGPVDAMLEKGRKEVSPEHKRTIQFVSKMISRELDHIEANGNGEINLSTLEKYRNAGRTFLIGDVCEEIRVQVCDDRYRIPDISFQVMRPGGEIQQWAIEVQRSKISAKTLHKRSEDMKAAGIYVVWLCLPRIFEKSWTQAARDISGIHRNTIIAANESQAAGTEGQAFEVHALVPKGENSLLGTFRFQDLQWSAGDFPYFIDKTDNEYSSMALDIFRDSLLEEIEVEGGDVTRSRERLANFALEQLDSKSIHNELLTSQGNILFRVIVRIMCIWGEKTRKTAHQLAKCIDGRQIFAANQSSWLEPSPDLNYVSKLYPSIISCHSSLYRDYTPSASSQQLLVEIFPEVFDPEVRRNMIVMKTLPRWAELAEDVAFVE